MITLLRKFRKSLISSGARLDESVGRALRKPTSAAGRYILYAAGEVLLVMIGILLALQVNNWNEFRKERKQEHRLYQELTRTLENNCQMLRDGIEFKDLLNSSSLMVISNLQEEVPYSDTMSSHFMSSRIFGSTIWMNQAGYERLKNEGFNVISNDSLANHIIELFEVSYSKLIGQIDYYLSLQPPRQDYMDKIFIQDSRNGELGLYPFDYNLLLKDNYFLSILKRQASQRNLVKNEEINCLNETLRVLQLVKEEVRRNEWR